MATDEYYKQVSADVAEEITDEEAKKLAYEVIPNRNICASITNSTQFLRELDRNGYISQKDVSKLMKLLENRGYRTAAKKLEGYHNALKKQQQSPPLTDGTSQDSADGQVSGHGELFISFSNKDQDAVSEFGKAVDGVLGRGTCWKYIDRMEPGDDIDEEIVDAINGSKGFVAMVTQDFIDSVPCQEELRQAKQMKKKIYVVILADVATPYKRSDSTDSPMQLVTAGRFYSKQTGPEKKKNRKKLIETFQKDLRGID